MALNLRVISYNCQSFNSKTQIIESLLNSCDILCLQETLLNDENSSNLDKLDHNFLTAHVPAVRNLENFRGRASGGLALFWRKSDNVKCFPVLFSDRVMGLRIHFNDINYLLLNVYCFCDYGNIDSLINYKSLMADISNICENESYDDIVITGDMNADPNKDRFFKEYSNLVETHSFFMADISHLPSTSYTYISPTATCATSWLDHVITSRADPTSNHKILYGLTFYDHVPIFFNLTVPFHVNFTTAHNSCVFPQEIILWDKVTEEQKISYCTTLDNFALYLSGVAFSCSSVSCSNEVHLSSLETIYENLMECISVASDCLPSYKKYDKKHKIIGWNRYCKDLYALARDKFLAWHINGRIRHGAMFDEMKSSRNNFKNALKFCRKNELKIRKHNLLTKFNHGNKVVFWKELGKLYGNKNNNVSYIDGISDPIEVASLFDRKYNEILDDINCQTVFNNVSMGMAEITRPDNFMTPLITLNNIHDATEKLNFGLGWDKIHSNHIKFSGPIFKNLLSKIFNKFLSHKLVPRKMLGGQIKPIIKNNSLSKIDSSNYRPVMNSSNLLKVFEYCLQPFLSNHLKLNNLQFGFRTKTSCPSAVLVLKETVLKYTRENSNVHCAMVDLSKAFDRINYSILMTKLRATSLQYMYYNTCVNVIFQYD